MSVHMEYEIATLGLFPFNAGVLRYQSSLINVILSRACLYGLRSIRSCSARIVLARRMMASQPGKAPQRNDEPCGAGKKQAIGQRWTAAIILVMRRPSVPGQTRPSITHND